MPPLGIRQQLEPPCECLSQELFRLLRQEKAKREFQQEQILFKTVISLNKKDTLNIHMLGYTFSQMRNIILLETNDTRTKV